MSRETQYIGLTNDARKYVEENAISKESYLMTTGMFEENVHGDIYELQTISPDVNKRTFVKEVVQASPWSSGPMIFTCLELFVVKHSGQEVSLGKIFQWVANPTVGEAEIDYNRGHYWI